MRKFLKIVGIFIVLVGALLLVVGLIPKDKEPELHPDEWGEGDNPFKPGTPKYANFEKVRKAKEEAMKKEIEDLLNVDDHGKED